MGATLKASRELTRQKGKKKMTWAELERAVVATLRADVNTLRADEWGAAERIEGRAFYITRGRKK